MCFQFRRRYWSKSDGSVLVRTSLHPTVVYALHAPAGVAIHASFAMLSFFIDSPDAVAKAVTLDYG